MRKYIALTLVVVLCIALVAVTESATVERGCKALKVWGNPKAWEGPIKEFNKKYPNIKVNVQQINLGGGDMNVFMMSKALANQLPDIISDMDFDGAKFISLKKLLPLDKYITAEKVLSWPWINPRSVAKAFDGHYYSLCTTVYVNGFWYNIDIAKACGVYDDIPKSYDDPRFKKWDWNKFVEVLKKVTKDTDGDGKIDQYGSTDTPGWGVWGYVAANGTQYWGVDKSAKPPRKICNINFTDPTVLETYQFIADLHNKYKVGPPPDVDIAAAGLTIEQGTVLGQYMGSWVYTYFEEAVNKQREKEGKPPLRFGFAPFPFKPGFDPAKSLAFVQIYNNCHITTQSKYPNAAWELIKARFGPDYEAKYYDIVKFGGSLPRFKHGDIKAMLAKTTGEDTATLFIQMLERADVIELGLMGQVDVPSSYRPQYPAGSAPNDLLNAAMEKAWHGKTQFAEECPELTKKVIEMYRKAWEAYDKEQAQG